jgi:pyruvate dehydrogenase E1 component alpha subunit
MLTIREFEERLYKLFLTDTMPGTMHQYTGQEAVAVGVCAALDPADYITSTHRGHGHAIAKGVSLRSLMAEMFSKDTGCCRGMGGSMHVSDGSVGLMVTTGIVGGGIPIATGLALAAQMQQSDRVAVAFFGDGASNEGAFHEGLNQAGVWKLPVIFVCENNMYGFSVSFETASAVSDVANRASSYGFPGMVVDGNNVLEVYEASKAAVERARTGGGPTLIECKTYRHRGHSRFERAAYRPDGELEEWLTHDPIPRFKDLLIQEQILTSRAYEQMMGEVMQEIADAVSFARDSSEPPPDASLHYVYAETEGAAADSFEQEMGG